MHSQAPHPEDIKAAVRKRGTTMRQLMIEAGHDPSDGSKCLVRRIHPPRETIARFLGVQLHQLWPADYDDDDLPIYRRGRPNLSRQAHARRVKKPVARAAA